MTEEEKNQSSGKQKNEAGIRVNYYSIDEDAARRAKEMNSFFGYRSGSATEEYRSRVDEAAEREGRPAVP